MNCDGTPGRPGLLKIPGPGLRCPGCPTCERRKDSHLQVREVVASMSEAARAPLIRLLREMDEQLTEERKHSAQLRLLLEMIRLDRAVEEQSR